MKDLLIIFITLLLLLTLISTFGGSIRFRASGKQMKEEFLSPLRPDMEQRKRNTVESFESLQDWQNPPNDQDVAPIVSADTIDAVKEDFVNTPVIVEEPIARQQQPLVISEERIGEQGVCGYDGDEVYASF